MYKIHCNMYTIVYHIYILIAVGVCIIFFFFKQKTAYEMRISDWSSDVCSSDLNDPGGYTQSDIQPASFFQRQDPQLLLFGFVFDLHFREGADRKSTRLNSSH